MECNEMTKERNNNDTIMITIHLKEVNVIHITLKYKNLSHV